jgi:DNA-binding transcriptional LysR family regulator
LRLRKHGDRGKSDVGRLFTAACSVHAVEHGDVSVGFIEGEVPSRIVESSLIGTKELVIVTSDRAFAEAQSYTIDELLEYRWILRERGSGTRDALLYQLREKGQLLNVFMELDQIVEISFSVEVSTGISVDFASSRGVPIRWHCLSIKQKNEQKRAGNII